MLFRYKGNMKMKDEEGNIFQPKTWLGLYNRRIQM